MAIFNATQHTASPEQLREGVLDTSPEVRKHLSTLLTFEEVPCVADLRDRAALVADLIQSETTLTGIRSVMIGGAPYFMTHLETALKARRLTPLYAFSKRESIEDPVTGQKTSVFKHAGWIGC